MQLAVGGLEAPRVLEREVAVHHGGRFLEPDLALVLGLEQARQLRLLRQQPVPLRAQQLPGRLRGPLRGRMVEQPLEHRVHQRAPGRGRAWRLGQPVDHPVPVQQRAGHEVPGPGRRQRRRPRAAALPGSSAGLPRAAWNGCCTRLGHRAGIAHHTETRGQDRQLRCLLAGWLAGGRYARCCAGWLAGGRYARCLPGERCSPDEGAPIARRENSAAAARELAGFAGASRRVARRGDSPGRTAPRPCASCGRLRRPRAVSSPWPGEPPRVTPDHVASVL